MLDRRSPRIKRDFSLIPHGPDMVELRQGVWNAVSHTLVDESGSGKLYALLERLTGASTTAEIAREVCVTIAEVDQLVEHLSDLGVVESAATTALDHYLDTLVPWRRGPDAPALSRVLLLGDPQLGSAVGAHLRELPPGTAVETVDHADEAWLAVTDPDRAWLLDGLEFEQRLQLFEPWRDALVVLACRAVDPLLAQSLNRVCAAMRIPWLHAAIDGPFILIGPTVLPQRTACYECLELRVTMNLRQSASYQRYKQRLAEGEMRGASPPTEPAVAGLLAAHTALDVLNFLATGYAVTIGKVLGIYLPTMEITYNEVLRSPLCPACSPAPERDETELYFDMSAIAG